jgi:hypothetical protein
MGFLDDLADSVGDAFLSAGEAAFAEAGGHAYAAAAAVVAARNQELRHLPTEISSGHKLALRAQFGDLVDKARVTYSAWTLEGFSVLGQRIGASAQGQAYGYQIYVKAARDDDADTLLRRLAHELQHVRQFVDAGESLVLFGNRYFRAYYRAGFRYARNDMEEEADRVAACFMLRRSADVTLTERWRPKPAWTAGWTDFAPFELGGAAHYLSHKTATGDVAIDRVQSDGTGVTTLWRDRPGAGRMLARWTHLMSFAEAGRPYVLAYNTESGAAAIHRIREGAQGLEEVWRPQSPWTKGWTSFMPFLLDGKPHFLSYKAASGEPAIDRIEPKGHGLRSLWRPSARWSTGWTAFAPFRRGAEAFYFAYKAGNGDAAIDRIKPDGSGVEELWRIPADRRWPAGYTAVVPLELRGEVYLLLYSGPQHFGFPDAIAGSGHAAIFHLEATDKAPKRIWCDNWSRGWTSFVPFQLDLGGGLGRCPHYLAYKRAEGDVVIDRLSIKGAG